MPTFILIPGYRYWEEEVESVSETSPWYRRNSPAINVEVTSYALLAQLELNDLEYSKNIVEWLLDKRQSSKEFESTQVNLHIKIFHVTIEVTVIFARVYPSLVTV